jgi:hypothetical protein
MTGIKMEKQPGRRHAFILTIWTEGDPRPNAPPIWRFSLQDARTMERRGFKDLAALTRFVEEWTAEWPKEDADNP